MMTKMEEEKIEVDLGKVELAGELENPNIKSVDYKPAKHNVGTLEEIIDEDGNINP